MLKEKPLLLSRRLTFKMQRALVILTSSVYGNKIQTLCESVGEKLSRPFEGGDHFLHGFFRRITQSNSQSSLGKLRFYSALHDSHSTTRELWNVCGEWGRHIGASITQNDERKIRLDLVIFMQQSSCYLEKPKVKPGYACILSSGSSFISL